MSNTSDNELPDLIDDHSEDSSEEDFMDKAQQQQQIKVKVNKLKDEGNNYFCQGKYTFAIEKYVKALAVNDELTCNKNRLELYFKLKNNIAQCFLKRKLYKDALDAAADAIDAGSDQVKSFIRASKAFAAMEYYENAYGVLKKGMVQCNNDKDEINVEMRMLTDTHPKLGRIRDKNWGRKSVREVAEDIKRVSEAEKRKKKEAEEKKRVAAAAKEEERKLKEEEDQKRKEEQARIDKKEEELRRTKEQKRKDMEEQIVMTALPKEMSKQIKFTEYLQKGSEAMQNKVALTAFECTSKALEILKTDYENLDISEKHSDESSNPLVVTLRYIHARAAVETNEYENILIAKENYELILNHYNKVRFPAVYLGLALMYKKLNRYDEARKYADMAKNYKFNSTAMFWPGFPTKVLEETLREELSKLLENLIKELEIQPVPDAICKYVECTSHANQTHILPSENIYLSDPDYRGHIRLVCSDSCRLSYHKTCWQLLKSSYIEEWHLSKQPTEKDFIGRQCVTPDCEGVSIRVEIYNQDGDVHNIEDAKVMERLEEESKKRKLEEKQRRKEDYKKSSSNGSGGAKAKKVKKKKKASESPASEDQDSSEHCSAKENSAEPVQPVDSIGYSIPVPQVDYSKIDLSTATVLNKHTNKQEEAGDALHLDTTELTNNNNNKKKKAKKQVMSLQEFHVKALGTELTTENAFDSRIREANKYKSMIENYGTNPIVPGGGVPGPGPVPGNQIWNGAPQQSVTSPWNSQQSNAGGSIVAAVVPNEESAKARYKIVLDNLYSLLKELGPLHYENPQIWFMLEDYKDLINSFDNGLRSFIYMDTLNRFRQHKDYICLIEDLHKLLRMQNESPLPIQTGVQEAEAAENSSDDGEEYTDDSESEVEDDQKRVGDEEDKKWNEIKQLLGMETGQKVSIDALPNLNKLALNSNRTVSSGTQTDVSSIDLDDGGLDPFTLAQTNENLVIELQETRDQLFRVQKESKVNLIKLKESHEMLASENAKLHNEIIKLREQNAKERKIAQDFTEKEKTYKEKNENLNKKIRHLNVEVESEQKLSFNLNKSMLEYKAEIKTLKIFNIKVEAEYYKKEINHRLEQVNNFIKILDEMRHNPVMSQLTELITKAQVEVDSYSARLIEAQINIGDKLDQTLNNMPQDGCPSLDFDMKRLAMPKLDLNLFMFFLDIKSDTDRKIKEAVAARQLLQQQQRGVGGPLPPPNMYSSLQPPPLNTLLRPGMNGSLVGLVPPPPSSPLRGNVLLDPPPRQLQSPDGSGGNTPTSNSDSAPGFPVGGNRANAFSPPLSRPSGASSPFNTAPPSVRSPSPLHSVNQPRPAMSMMQPIGTRSMHPPSSTAGGGGPQLMRPQNPGGPHMQGVRPPVGMPFRANLPPPAMPSAAQMKPPPQEGASGDAAVKPGRKKNEDILVDKICDRYVGIDREKARSYVKQVRQNNGGKLTGMNIPTILQKVQELASADESKDCSICLCELPERPFVTRCGHQFHKYCLDQWLQQETSGNACPNCREFLTNDEEFPQLG